MTVEEFRAVLGGHIALGIDRWIMQSGAVAITVTNDRHFGVKLVMRRCARQMIWFV